VPPLRALIILFCVAVTAHNLEEAFYLPAWSGVPEQFRKPNAFIFSVVMLTLLLYLTAFMSIKRACKGGWIYFLNGYALAMFLNALVPHLLASLYFQSYAPGTASSVLLVMPAAIMLMRKSCTENYIDKRKFYIAGPVIVFAIMTSIPLLFFSYQFINTL